MSDYRNLYDVIIVGGGPAGLAAATYAARAKERVLVIEKNDFGGQIALTSKVNNYPGIIECSGKELAEQMKKQAEDFGAELIKAEITDMQLDLPIKKISTDHGVFQAIGVILAPGSIPRSAGFEGEDTYRGKGVANCATCDGPFFEGCDIYVVGGGLSAVEEAIYLTKYGKKIHLIVRENDFTCAKKVSDRLKLYPNIQVRFHTEIVKVEGDDTISSVTLRDQMSGKISEETSKDLPMGVFVFVGYMPNTAWLPAGLDLDEAGYIMTDINNKTNIDGIYAAGDVRQKSLRQVVTATSDGAVAAVALESLVEKVHQSREIPCLVDDSTSSQELTVTSGKALLKLWLDDSKLSGEILEFMDEQTALKEKVIIEIHKEGREDLILPSIEICYEDGKSSGVHFHAVPKGLEWNSFQMALFNVIGPGQKLDEDILRRIQAIDQKINIKILASLTCGNCPASIMAANQIALLNENVTAEMFDLMHFRKLRFKYQVTSVPVLIINDRRQGTGKMDIKQMLDEIEKYQKIQKML